MKNKGRRHKSGNGPYANVDCKGYLTCIKRPETSMSSLPREYKGDSNKWLQKKWNKRMRGFFKTSRYKEINGL